MRRRPVLLQDRTCLTPDCLAFALFDDDDTPAGWIGIRANGAPPVPEHEHRHAWPYAVGRDVTDVHQRGGQVTAVDKHGVTVQWAPTRWRRRGRTTRYAWRFLDDHPRALFTKET